MKGKLEMSDLRIQQVLHGKHLLFRVFQEFPLYLKFKIDLPILQLSGGDSILDNSTQIDQLVTEKSELQSKAEQVQ